MKWVLWKLFNMLKKIKRSKTDPKTSEDDHLTIDTRYEWRLYTNGDRRCYIAKGNGATTFIICRDSELNIWNVYSSSFGDVSSEDRYSGSNINEVVSHLEERYFDNILINGITERRGF